VESKFVSSGNDNFAPAQATLQEVDYNVISIFEAISDGFRVENVRKDKNPAQLGGT
jgi:hypothetical protein